jgi:flavorubredoxin
MVKIMRKILSKIRKLDDIARTVLDLIAEEHDHIGTIAKLHKRSAEAKIIQDAFLEIGYLVDVVEKLELQVNGLRHLIAKD